jgi:hypothetical protein
VSVAHVDLAGNRRGVLPPTSPTRTVVLKSLLVRSPQRRQALAQRVGNRTARSMTSCQSSRLASSATWRDSMVRSSAPMRSCSRRSM